MFGYSAGASVVAKLAQASPPQKSKQFSATFKPLQAIIKRSEQAILPPAQAQQASSVADLLPICATAIPGAAAVQVRSRFVAGLGRQPSSCFLAGTSDRPAVRQIRGQKSAHLLATHRRQPLWARCQIRGEKSAHPLARDHRGRAIFFRSTNDARARPSVSCSRTMCRGHAAAQPARTTSRAQAL